MAKTFSLMSPWKWFPCAFYADVSMFLWLLASLLLGFSHNFEDREILERIKRKSSMNKDKKYEFFQEQQIQNQSLFVRRGKWEKR